MEIISNCSFQVTQNFTRISFTPEGRTHKICNIKDIIFNYKNSLILNFSNIKKLIVENEKERQKAKEETEDDKFAFYCNLMFHEIVTRNKTKSCMPILVKCKFINNHYSFPYDFINE